MRDRGRGPRSLENEKSRASDWSFRGRVRSGWLKFLPKESEVTDEGRRGAGRS